tara:strand:- start:110 stop:241 length:132 start_codon:yes stop_codon:yes gene_type:complete
MLAGLSLNRLLCGFGESVPEFEAGKGVPVPERAGDPPPEAMMR